MPHTTTTTTTTQARTGRPASVTTPARRPVTAPIPVMPLWQGLAQLFAPVDSAAVRP
ncbi:hypothetical protein ACWC09_51550 [Streptomyces sp. NPDC001617]